MYRSDPDFLAHAGPQTPGQSLAVIGAGISGLSAAWLLSQGHQVTLFEAEPRLGGHSFTTDAQVGNGSVPVDMGFIVYNTPCYPNLTALFAHLGVETEQSDMSFGVSVDNGAFEYASSNLKALLAQPYNVLRPRFLTMVADILRFYREAPASLAALDDPNMGLGDYLERFGYSEVFIRDHMLPQAAAIWSTSAGEVRQYPIKAFIAFCENHGLMKLTGRPKWRTVTGGSRSYVRKIKEAMLATGRARIEEAAPIVRITRTSDGVVLTDVRGQTHRFDQVVVATHSDQALPMIENPTEAETRLLGAIGYSPNKVVLHTDTRLMPVRKAAWSSWNYVGSIKADPSAPLCVTYWMNKLQNLTTPEPLLVTLNPDRAIDPTKVIKTQTFAHPTFTREAILAQEQLWSLQGVGGIWYCGAWFGAGFHEDGLQAGLAVAEDLGGIRRPWTVENDSGRIVRGPLPSKRAELALNRSGTAQGLG